MLLGKNCVLWILLGLSTVYAVRVCNNFKDYSFASISPNCYDSPVLDQNISEIIRDWGFQAQEHYLTTPDGYKILVERAFNQISQRNPIIIVHGMVMNALGWVNRGKKSLPLVLGNLGYDVWMLNYRGTKYSREHVNLTTNDDAYWKFSVDELGMYDVRTTVKYVYKMTNRQAIYIGYSMGTTGFYAYSTTFPEEAEMYLKGMVGLAPVINYKDLKSVIKLLAPIWPTVEPITYKLWHGELIPGYQNLMKPFLKSTAGIYTLQFFMSFVFGDDYEQMDPLTYPLFILQLTDTTGARDFGHYFQIYCAGVFQRYDYGKEQNLKLYGTTNPPAYNISKVPIPVSLFVGENDWISTQTNAKQLYSELNPSMRCGYNVIKFPKWNHLDFIVAKDIQFYLFKDLINKLNVISSGMCSP